MTSSFLLTAVSAYIGIFGHTPSVVRQTDGRLFGVEKHVQERSAEVQLMNWTLSVDPFSP